MRVRLALAHLNRGVVNWLAAMLLAIPLAGCRKSGDQPGPTPVYYGVKVDVPKLDTEFVTASEEVKASAGLIKQSFRYAQLPQALAELGKLAGNSSLTESQKKVVRDLTEQIKKVIANSSPSATP